MNDRGRLLLLGPIMGFFVVIAFGVGVIATAAYDRNEPSAPSASAPSQEITVELGDLYIKPDSLSATAGPASFQVRNQGQSEHNFSITGVAETPMIPPGESYTLEVPDLAAGTYEVLCQVSGHAAAGMTGELVVAERTTTVAHSQHQGSASAASSMSPEEMVRHDAEVTKQFPAETQGRGGRIIRPHITSDRTKVFELTAEAIQWETEPGKIVEAWAYNGMVPGPTIRAQLGDRVRVILHNELPEATTIHFHGLEVPPDMDGVPVISQDAVLPGDSFTYEFTVKNTGSHMYHSHFDAQKQVPMGLLGAFVVKDPRDPRVDRDYTMILNDGPLGFTLNGKGFPATEPVPLLQGQTMRVRYMNEGLQIHPMHLHGLTQTVIAKDGRLLQHPYGADTVLVGPGERYDVLVRADHAGVWAWHCHVLNHAESGNGMFGMVTAVIVE